MTREINIKVTDSLRAQAHTRAGLIGSTFPEFVRDKCADVKRLHGQRERAAKAAARAAGPETEA